MESQLTGSVMGTTMESSPCSHCLSRSYNISCLDLNISSPEKMPEGIGHSRRTSTMLPNLRDVTSPLRQDTLGLLPSETGADDKWQPLSPGSNPDDEEILSELRAKRRAQNRESQRAFRERKKQHVQNLENKLQKLLKRHEEIISLYTKQSMEIARLDQKVDDLALELLMCQANGNHGTVVFPPKESNSEASSSSGIGTRSSLPCSEMECWGDNHINANYGSSVDTQ